MLAISKANLVVWEAKLTVLGISSENMGKIMQSLIKILATPVMIKGKKEIPIILYKILFHLLFLRPIAHYINQIHKKNTFQVHFTMSYFTQVFAHFELVIGLL